MTASGRATRFPAENLQYPRASFDAVLLWDLLDYLEPALVNRCSRPDGTAAPGGVISGDVPQQRSRRVPALSSCGSNTLQVISTRSSARRKRSTKREIQDLFGRYRR